MDTYTYTYTCRGWRGLARESHGGFLWTHIHIHIHVEDGED